MATTSASSARDIQKGAQQWQKKMMTRAHQWEMSDLITAGLNPILTATGGSPTSFSSPTPGGGAGDLADIGGAVGKGVSSARETSTFNANMKQAEMNVLGTRSLARKNQAEAGQTDQQKQWERDTYEHRRQIQEYGANTARETAVRAKHDAEMADTNAQIQKSLLPGAKAMAEAQSSSTGQVTKKVGTIIDNITAPLGRILGGSGNIHRGTTTIENKPPKRRRGR